MAKQNYINFIICTFLLMHLFPHNHHAQTQKGIDLDGAAMGDNFGYSVNMSDDGNTLAIGAPYNDDSAFLAGHARIYTWNGSAWAKKGNDIGGQNANDYAGWAVAIDSSGNTVVVGAPLNDNNGNNSGQARVFLWDGVTWIQKGGDINGEAANDEFGKAVIISSNGNVVAIGARKNDGNGSNSGHVRVFEWNGATWVQKGNDIDGEAASDEFGSSVSLSLDGNILAVGAQLNDGISTTNAGHVRVFEWNGTAWMQKGNDIDGEAIGDNSGNAVALDPTGNQVAIGALYNKGNGFDSGHARVFEWNGTAWVQKGNDIDGDAVGDHSGFSVALKNNTLAIGAPSTGGGVGQVRVFSWDNNSSSWIQRGNKIYGEIPSDYSGSAIALSNDGNTVAIGAYGNDGNGSNSGHVRVYEIPLLAVEILNTTNFINNYPNPTTGHLVIDLGKIYNDIVITVTDIVGCQIQTIQNTATDKIDLLLNGAPGIYFANISSEKKHISLIKIIKI